MLRTLGHYLEVTAMASGLIVVAGGVGWGLHLVLVALGRAS